MTLQEFILSISNNNGVLSVVIIALLLLVEITPIKINTLSWLAKNIGKAFNGEVMKEIGYVKTEMGSVRQEVERIKTDVSDIRDEAKEREATNRRARILEFGDEILHEVDYSKEHWDSVLMDISAYENYCYDHPHYMNNVAKATIRHIKDMYQKHLQTDSFLK